MHFKRPDNPQNCPFSLGALDLVPLAHLSQPPERHIDRFRRFLQSSHVTNRQTDRHATPSVAIGRI